MPSPFRFVAPGIHGSWTRGDRRRAGCVALFAHAGLACAGCNHELYSPPARMLPLESPATLARGETGVQAEGATQGAIFGPSVETGTLRVREGMADATDATAEVSVLHVDGRSVADTYPYAFAGRVGLKHAALPWLSLVGGLGGGASAGGGFVSPDVGVIAGYENRWAVPFVSLRVSVSVPFDGRPVDTGQAGHDALGQYVYTPPFTWIGGGTVGLRVPVGRCDPGTSCVHGSLLGGLGLTELAYAGASAGLMSLAGGGEIVF